MHVHLYWEACISLRLVVCIVVVRALINAKEEELAGRNEDRDKKEVNGS